MNCIFCKIVSGEAESVKVFEDEEILAFMDIQPVREGQILVIPKTHIDHFTDIPNELGIKIFVKAQEIGRIVRRKLQPQRIGFVVHGYGVAHAHMIIVPQQHEDDITTGRMAEIQDEKIVFSMRNLQVISNDKLVEIAEIIKSEL